MTRISAADNMVVDMQPSRWHLLINTNFVDNVQGDGVLVEAIEGQPLRYTSAFARTRHLPRSGALATSYVQRVVLGWSWDDEAWHLGLLLAPEIAESRGSRWCELVQWPDPEQDVYYEDATRAGEALARQLGCPFNLIPIKPEHQTEAVDPVQPLPPLPVRLEGWTLRQHPKHDWLVLARDKSWRNERRRRVVWYGAWSVIYVALSVLVLVSDIAHPRPLYLPYIAIAVGVMLLGLSLYARHELRTHPQRITIDPQTHRIWAQVPRQKQPIWQMTRTEIDTVYLSEVLKANAHEVTQQYGEVNLRLTDGGAFHFLFNQDEKITIRRAKPAQGDAEPQPLDPVEAELGPFNQNDAVTPLQVAGYRIANALAVPVWIDRRVK